MKRPIQLPGQRDWAGDDLIELNSESLKAIEALIEPYPMCVLSGCEVTASGDKYKVSPGYVVLKGVGYDGLNVNRIVPFAGLNDTILPLYLKLNAVIVSDVYGDGQSKAIAHNYKAEAATVKPSVGDYLTINTTGTTKFTDALQDSTHRFITDSERTSWNAKETPSGATAKDATTLATAKSYAEAQATAVDGKLTTHSGDTTKHITAAERTSWNAKETPTGAAAKDAATLAEAKVYTDAFQSSTRNYFIATDEFWRQGSISVPSGDITDNPTRIMLKQPIEASSTHVSVDRISTGYEMCFTFHRSDNTYLDRTHTNGLYRWWINDYPSTFTIPTGTAFIYVLLRKTNDTSITPQTSPGKQFMITLGRNIVGWTAAPEDIESKATKSELQTHSTNTTNHITAAERTSWNAKETTTGADAKDATTLATAQAYTDAAITDIEIGSENLVDNSVATTPWTGNSTKYQITNWNQGSDYIIKGQTYTIVSELYVDDEFNGQGIGFWVNQTHRCGDAFFKPRTPTVITHTFVAETTGYLAAYHVPDKSAGNSYINWVKLVKGNKASLDHSYSAAYKQAKIDAIEIGVENMIDNSMTTIPWTGNADRYQINNWQQGSNYIIEGQTYTLVSELYVDEAFNGQGIGFWIMGDRQCGDKFFKPLTPTVVAVTFVAEYTGFLAAYHFPNKSAGNSYINWVKLVKGDKASLDHSYSTAHNLALIGGTNLLANTKSFEIRNVIDLDVTLDIGHVYTLSIGQSTSTAGGQTKMLLLNTMNQEGDSAGIYNYLDFGSKKSVTFTAAYNKLVLYAGELWSSGNRARIENLKLEKGNKATNWSPSPLDLQGQLDTKMDHFNNYYFDVVYNSVQWQTKDYALRPVKVFAFYGQAGPKDTAKPFPPGIKFDYFHVELGCLVDQGKSIRHHGDGWLLRVASDGQMYVHVTDAMCAYQTYNVVIKYIDR